MIEKIFYPNKWFVAFCGLLVVVWASLQWVINMRIADEAKAVGQEIFTWSWASCHWRSTAQMTRADVLRRSATDAIVKVQGRQVLTIKGNGLQGANAGGRSEVVDCSATLTFYRLSNHWQLAKVELD